MSHLFPTLRLLSRNNHALQKFVFVACSSSTDAGKPVLKTGDRIKKMLSKKEANKTRDGFDIEPPVPHGLGDFHAPHPGVYPRIPREFDANLSEEDWKATAESDGDLDHLEYRYHIPNYETEEFTFDSDTGILQEQSDEKDFFDRIVYPYTQNRSFRSLAAKLDEEVSGVKRKVETSKNEDEWKFVERLLPQTIVPNNFDYKVYPSGFVPPNPNNKEDEKLEYYVGRTRNMLLPVYTDYYRSHELVVTRISKCEGNLYKLRDDVRQFLVDRYEQDFISQVSEVYGRIVFRGDFEVDLKQFLIEKGF